MTTDLAAVQSGYNNPAIGPLPRSTSRTLIAGAMERVANDTGSPTPAGGLDEPLLKAALQHFAEHGLGAAQTARARAEAALGAGDRSGYRWWLEITRTLDARLADEAQRAPRERRVAWPE
ncbi:MAG: hypothetical protein QNI87_05925 [Erythrobacter sp.]|uniref:hypothetical protein n=1 Tax=Erythrobacter sp. TaxID=1042 RepID=UPI002638F3B6|nr:hypothetical protein [Erythrobacter sp.]MDJ0978053.1 hypothetical protein [Erythrobacter sp.]